MTSRERGRRKVEGAEVGKRVLPLKIIENKRAVIIQDVNKSKEED